jgi:Tfp pilus assembly pilus retraction ATPase PilT
MDIDELLKRCLESGASDLHLRVPSRPLLRIDGKLIIQQDLEVVSPDYRCIKQDYNSGATECFLP